MAFKSGSELIVSFRLDSRVVVELPLLALLIPDSSIELRVELFIVDDDA